MGDSSHNSAPDLDILGDQVTLHPSGYIEELKSQQDEGNEHNLVENTASFRSNPLEYSYVSFAINLLTDSRFLREVSLHVSGKGWRAYDNYIGQPICYPAYSENMISNVLSTPILKSKISELADMRVKVEVEERLFLPDDPLYIHKISQRKRAIEQSLTQLCEKLTSNMICRLDSKRFIRSAYFICSQLLTKAYHQGKLFNHDEELY